LSDIVDDNGAVCISVVHGSKRLVAFLAGGIPNFELDGSVLIKRNGLGQEGSADGGLAIGIELVLEYLGELLSQYNDVGASSSYLDKSQDY
jgi:hypothetical protein